MFHDDDCGVFLDADGRCPECGFHPDMQSTSFKDADEAEVEGWRRAGMSFLGLRRQPLLPLRAPPDAPDQSEAG